MGYIGNEPTTGHFPVDNFTSSGGSTYTLAKAPASAGAIEVSVQGVLQPTTAYTVSGTTLTMAGVTTGVKIFVRHLGETLSLPTPADGSVTTAKLGTNSVDGTKIAMGSDARGDILYHGATDYARLAKGTSGHVLTMGANDPAWAAAVAGGITEADMWRLTTEITGTNDFITANLERVDTPLTSLLGTGMSESSGVFTFPSTGYWLIEVCALFYGASDNSMGCETHITLDNGTYVRGSRARHGNAYSTAAEVSHTGHMLLDVTSTTLTKVKFKTTSLGGSSELKGHSDGATGDFTSFMFIRLGDT